MKLVGLFSGGKDSTYSIYKTIQDGNSVECLVTIFPKSEESMLLHYPNIEITKLQSSSMRIPQIYTEATSNQTDSEIDLLALMLQKAKQDYAIEGLVQGGILSNFQKNNFQKVCNSLQLELVSPVWQQDQKQYMQTLLDSKFRFIITSVSADGLDESWLGKEITHDELDILEKLSQRYGFNLNFEGGEAETLVIDCPLFSYPVNIVQSKKIWDGYRGRLEILDAVLDYKSV